MEQVSIYALQNPLKGQLFYVGSTILKITDRLFAHKTQRIVPSVATLMKIGISPIIGTLEICEPKDKALREQHWINQLNSQGEPLENKRRTYKLNRNGFISSEDLYRIGNDPQLFCQVCIQTGYTPEKLIKALPLKKEQWFIAHALIEIEKNNN